MALKSKSKNLNPLLLNNLPSQLTKTETVKVLVGASPGGLISYISPAYGGSTSDRQLQIVERSPLTNICEPGDSIMSDKGFNVQDLFAPNDVKVNIPTFFKKKNRISNKTVLRDRKISSKRVHIERLIGLAKTYKILKGPLNSTQTKLASEISYVCFIMCNFRKYIPIQVENFQFSAENKKYHIFIDCNFILSKNTFYKQLCTENVSN